LKTYMRKGSYKFCYCDTDSFMLALTRDNIDDCVRADLCDEWFKEIKPKWFATDDRRSQKEPGLLKEEERITRGWFIAPTPKCYILSQMEPNEVEKAILTSNNPHETLREIQKQAATIEATTRKRSSKGCKTAINLS
jgi:hypothetical protein